MLHLPALVTGKIILALIGLLVVAQPILPPQNKNMEVAEMKYRGIVTDDLKTLGTRKTKWYGTYKEAHDAAEKLCKRTMGDCGSIDVERTEEVVEMETTCKFTLDDGLEYTFEVLENPQGQEVLVAFYTKNGESFGIWTAEENILPKNQEEAQEMIDSRDWEVENMSYLRENGFAPQKDAVIE